MTDAARLPELPPLRPYQVEGLRAVRAKAAELRRARGPAAGYGVLIVGPTGMGKTRTALDIVMGAIAKGKRALWLAPRTELVSQPVAKLAECGWTDVRVIQAGETGREDAPLIVASIQTLVAREQTPPADVVVLDEARHYAAADWGQIAAAYKGAVRIGLDATPARADGRPLGDLFDAIVPISSVAELVELWHASGGEMGLVPAVIDAPFSYGKDLAYDPVERWLTTPARGKRTIVFCKSRQHSRDTAAAFVAAGIAAEHVDADTPADVRKAAIDRLRTGETLVLCNVLLFTEGLDVPELEVVVIARGVSHVSIWLQIGGRALRPSNATGKTLARIIDLRGHMHRPGFGLLDVPRSWHLDGKPIRLLEKLPSCRQCRSCHSWSGGSGACPACGAEMPPPKPPKVTKREMKEFAREQIPRVGPEWELWRNLVETMVARGYKSQWAGLQFKKQTGKFPRWSVEQATRELAA